MNSLEVLIQDPILQASDPFGRRGGCFRGLYEVSLALVGVDLPGLIPILVYGFAECNSFLYPDDTGTDK